MKKELIHVRNSNSHFICRRSFPTVETTKSSLQTLLDQSYYVMQSYYVEHNLSSSHLCFTLLVHLRRVNSKKEYGITNIYLFYRKSNCGQVFRSRVQANDTF